MRPPSVFSDMADRELGAWVRAHISPENLTRDGEMSVAQGVSSWMKYLRSLVPAKQAAMFNSMDGRIAGAVLQFPGVPRNTHTLTIGGVKYVLSTLWPGVMGDLTEDAPEGVVRPDDMDPWKYLWVYDTDKQLLVMWRASDGNNKVWGSAKSQTHLIATLEKKGQLNRVDNNQFRHIEAEMSKRERENEASLEEWVEELKDDFQRQVDVAVQSYFDREVRPVMDKAIANVDAGAIPIGFKPSGGAQPLDRQMKAYVTGKIYEKLFNLDVIDAHMRELGHGLVQNPQATQWAQGDVWLAYAKSVLR